MKFTEKLLWILDKDCKFGWNEENTKQNIDFVHSLGLKCDSVGWSTLDLTSADAEKILDAITLFCREHSWGARGYYTREYAESDSTWYAIRFSEAKNDRYGNLREVPSIDGGTTEICRIKAYLEQPVSPKEIYETKFVPERFRNACIRLDQRDIFFCWAEDRGEYLSEQYFHPYPTHAVCHIAHSGHFCFSSKGLHKFDPIQKKRIMDLGGALPRLSEIFYELHIQLPNCYLVSELPPGGFSSAYIPRTGFAGGEQNILVHMDTVKKLIQQKVLSPAMLKPVPVLDFFPAGYVIQDVFHQSPPTFEVQEKMLAEYEKLKNSPRPVRSVSEKEALKHLRRAKKDRKEDFQKAMPKTKSLALAETDYRDLTAYYSISNGCFLSDEYELLSYERSLIETSAFYDMLQQEELLEAKPHGIVMAKCPDGDWILLCVDSSVIRFSHEAPETIEHWPSLAQFIVDAINEIE